MSKTKESQATSGNERLRPGELDGLCTRIHAAAQRRCLARSTKRQEARRARRKPHAYAFPKAS